jgi:release factor glutamine methyltransferase
MEIKELYRNFLVKLQDIYPLSEATVITDWVFEKLASVKRTDIVKEPAHQPEPLVQVGLQVALQQLLDHRPVQYVLGEAWFYHLKLKVNEKVFIPRPETEELVELVLNDRKHFLTDTSILDIGTGSGCIPIAIKKNWNAAQVSAIDVSTDALEMAKENAALQHVHINFIQCDFLDETQREALPQFDIIVSNPPYIPLNEKETMDKHVTLYEPHLALFGPDDDALIYYNRIAAFGLTHLKPGGKIYLEVHSQRAKKTAALFSTAYQKVEIVSDMYGKERMLAVTY